MVFDQEIFDIDVNVPLTLYKCKERPSKDDFTSLKSIFNIFQKEDHLLKAKTKVKKILFMAQINERKLFVLKKDGEVGIVSLFDPETKLIDFRYERSFTLPINQNEGIYHHPFIEERLLKFNPEYSHSGVVADYLTKP